MSIMSDFKYEEPDAEGAWILMQIADSAFPTGGFSHSIGFESATKHGFVKDFNAFTVFVLSCLQNAASFSLPFVNESHAECQNIEKIVELDGIMQAFLSNHVANKASFRQGNSLLVTACKTFEVEQIRSLQVRVETKCLIGHFAVVFGCICGLLKLPLIKTQQLFLFSTLRTVIASAVRLGNLGPLEAQSIQFKLQKKAEEIRKRYENCMVEEATTTAPVTDFLQGVHDSLFSKLFYS
ncbi:uncharacterized protein [Acropora muricata]|uniref:uncharacterized protein isoform X1 n=1 Tax=Acropora muricata TaxID=159855 RepID=UPI0034E47879